MFDGTDLEAIDFVMRTNKRRNLSSSQWAAVAVKAEDLVAAIKTEIEKNRRIKQAETQSETKSGDTIRQLIVSQPEPTLFATSRPTKTAKNDTKKPPSKTDRTLAGMFHTNPTYINDVSRIKKDNPAVFEQILSGEKTITEAKREEKIEN